jgi:hypothetical protein
MVYYVGMVVVVQDMGQEDHLMEVLVEVEILV